MAPAHLKLTGHIQWGKFTSPLPLKEWPASNYYLQHVTKSDYNRAFGEAREWKLANPTEQLTTAARIFSVKEEALKKSINRMKNKSWEIGLGATYDMVYAAICYLKKLIAYARLDTHTEEEVIDWFARLEEKLAFYKITLAKNILNMDESGARVGCPAGEHVIVLTAVKELYTSSPENRKSFTVLETIFADGREPLLPFVIAPGSDIMENWIAKELKGEEMIICTLTGYINNDKIIEYADHLIKHSRARPNKLWKLLLLDSYESHYCLEGKDPTAFSDNTLAIFRDTVSTAAIHLYKAHLTTLEHLALQEKIKVDGKRRRTSRRSIQKGGGAATAADLREKIKMRDERESGEALKKAQRKLNIAELLLLEDLVVIRDPEKHPNTLEEALITPEAFPELLVQVHEAEARAKFKVDDDEEVQFRFGDHYIEVVREYVDSELELEVVLNWSNLKESESEGEDSDNGSIDSIAENADFVGLSY
ncbi:uncharacterized protein RAG0_03054 [Rhynchosporium agropyri]|uniref:DDE-1 domain-containing protein n=1 Tax=Rhynchosporium agropyri TaxID=914238 RepID=A0A1E1K797_9HELO|nr:uncharacterized protein RAG0_03054 [Rhynchosporium agropyri]